MGQFETKTIEQITDVLIDYRGKTPPKTKSGVKLITAKVIKDGSIKDGNHEYISENYYDEWMRRGLPQQWDILITTEAPLGEVAQLRTPERVALAQRVILLRGKPELIDQNYYYQALKSPFAQKELQSRASGATVAGIRQTELLKVKIPYYPLSIQKRIAAILSAYDDLIENNTRRIQILEEMTRMMYREWFVQMRFPGHAPRADGKLPEGWQTSKFGELTDLVRNSINPARFADEQFLHYSIPAYDERQLPNLEYGSTIKSNKFIVPENSILLSKINPRIPRVWLTLADHQYRAIASSEFLPLLNKPIVTRAFLFALCISNEFLTTFAGLALGTSTSHQRVKPEDLLQIEVVLPNPQLILLFTERIGVMYDLIHKLRRKNANLRRTRDLLLPKLVSGEVDVSKSDIPTPKTN